MIVSDTVAPSSGATMQMSLRKVPSPSWMHVAAALAAEAVAATVTWANAPLGDGGIVVILGPVSRNTWIEIDVTGAVLGDGPFSLRIASIVNNGLDYVSKEHATGNAPELVIELD